MTTTVSPGQVPLTVTAEMAHTLAVHERVCVHPVLRTVTDRATEDSTRVAIACGSTRDSKCPPCAHKARVLRMHQCAEGWHLTEEPTDNPHLVAEDDQAEDLDSIDDDQAEDDQDEDEASRRVRSTRRRQDAIDLPKVPTENRTIGQAFESGTGKTYRPSMFVTLTLPSYGKVIPGVGAPESPGTYDYRRAALDALHFPKLVDRWVQNLRRCAGYQVQYFSAIEAQRRLAPHLHAAIRGAIPRATIKAVTKATYAQLWWPPFGQAVYVDRLPVWDRDSNCYRDADTGRALTTWEQALDDLDTDPDATPAHVMRFGQQVDIQGILGGTPDADRAVRYLTKYLTKAVADTHTDPLTGQPDPRMTAHVNRLHQEVRWLPCTPECANWLRYGIQPRDPGPGLTPGNCVGKAHEKENLGLGGRRVLASRKWSGKTLTEHRADRAAVVRQALEAAGMDAPEVDRCSTDVLHTDGRPRYVWEQVPVTAADYVDVLTASILERRRWRHQYEMAKAALGTGPPGPVDNCSATPTVAPAA